MQWAGGCGLCLLSEQSMPLQRWAKLASDVAREGSKQAYCHGKLCCKLPMLSDCCNTMNNCRTQESSEYWKIFILAGWQGSSYLAYQLHRQSKSLCWMLELNQDSFLQRATFDSVFCREIMWNILHEEIHFCLSLSLLSWMQRKMVNLGIDVAFVWQLWDARCADLAPLQRRIDAKMGDISKLMQSTQSSGKGSRARGDFAFLLDHGTPAWILVQNRIPAHDCTAHVKAASHLSYCEALFDLST